LVPSLYNGFCTQDLFGPLDDLQCGLFTEFSLISKEIEDLSNVVSSCTVKALKEERLLIGDR
jgi:hypothetical protein